MSDGKFDNEGRGSLWMMGDRKNEKAPIASGTITISGVDLRVAMWPKRKAGGTGARAGEEYWPLSVEYKQGTKFVLAKVAPSNIVVTGAAATASSQEAASDAGPAESVAVDDMPF